MVCGILIFILASGNQKLWSDNIESMVESDTGSEIMGDVMWYDQGEF